MLSYQHIYHAGNRADVQKHLWVITVIDYLLKKDKPFLWVDTHAGRGLYDLQAPEALKLEEFEQGILQAHTKLKADDGPLKVYADLIASVNKGKDLRYYPGSAYMAASMLRANDRLYAYDLHKGEFEHLRTALAPFKRVKVQKEDGLKTYPSLLPPPERRGGVLIDPSYEVKTEYAAVADSVKQALKKWPKGIYMIWYPILKSALYEELKSACAGFAQDIVIDEWIWGNAQTDKGMIGTGMIVINPPYTTSETMKAIKDHLEF